MPSLIRGVVLAAVLLSSAATAAQAPAVLRIKVVVEDAGRNPTPVGRHVLLVSENPPTALPRQVVTAADGTAAVQLRPGNYTVESDRPLVFEGKTYQWTQTIDVAAGRDTVLELGTGNAEVETAGPAGTPGAGASADPASVLVHWQNSVVALWTPTTRATGFVIGANGLIATSHRAIAAAPSVQVQLTPGLKVAGSLLASDPEHDVAVVRIDPTAAAGLRPVPLGCAKPAPVTVASGQRVYAVGAPLRQPRSMTSASVMGAGAHTVLAELILPSGALGGPVFTAGGELVGLTALARAVDARRLEDVRIVRTGDVCKVVAAAEGAMASAPAPAGTPLPVEPSRPVAPEALKEAAKGRAGRVTPYAVPASDFDVGLITPVLLYAAQNRPQASAGALDPRLEAMRPLIDFSNWSEYVAAFPPVLMIRVTPKLVEGFWTRVARGAARTQGVVLPPIKRFAAGFSQMRVVCGDRDVTPIHPFKIEQRIGESEAVYEGLYVFDPGALGPHCATVALTLYSDKDPRKGDTRVVDAKILEQVWQDFSIYREK